MRKRTGFTTVVQHGLTLTRLVGGCYTLTDKYGQDWVIWRIRSGRWVARPRCDGAEISEPTLDALTERMAAGGSFPTAQ